MFVKDVEVYRVYEVDVYRTFVVEIRGLKVDVVCGGEFEVRVIVYV